MNDQELLRSKLEEAVAFARTHKNVIAEQNFKNIFGTWVEDEAQKKLIEAYLKEKHILVRSAKEEADEKGEAFEMDLDEEDKSAIDFYYEELQELPHLTEREKKRITKKAMEGDEEARKKLIDIYLPDVVELSKLYVDHGIPMEDLIGEGNIALMLGVSMLECVESVEDVEGHIGKIIIEALEKLVCEEDSEEDLIVKLGAQLKKTAKAADVVGIVEGD